MSMTVRVAYVLSIAITIVYCAAIWYASGIFSVFFGTYEEGEFSLFLLLSIVPLPVSIWFGAIHWQLLAIASLVSSYVWGVSRASRVGGDQAFALPIVIHLAWIVLLVLWHALGAMSPMITVGHVLG